jgi:hypothetical protein
MSKGSKPAGNVTATNLTGEKQEPYLTDLWSQAQRLNNAWAPGSTFGTAGDENLILPGYDQLFATGRTTDQTLRPVANTAWTGAAGSGQGQNSPAYQYWQNLAGGNTAPQQALAAMGNAATTSGQMYGNQMAGYAPQAAQYGANAAAGNLGLSQLGQAASGGYLGGNPYFASMVQSALDPITKNYQTAISPQIDASFSGAGRYGSGAMLGQRGAAAEILAGQLAKTSSGMYGENYARERAAQDQAAQQYGSLYNSGQQLGMQGAGAAANIYDAAGRQYLSGLSQAQQAQQAALGGMATGAQGLQSGYQTGTSAALNAAQMYPQLGQAQLLGTQAMLEAGKGFNDWQAQYKQEPYKALQQYQQLIGPAIGAGTSQPYFQNQGANTMAGITGGLDIMSKIGGMASGGWIVCTELMRQGRMPKRHWAVGSCVFARYPKIGQRGYHFWGVPLVRHLRRKPYSLLSRAACAAFNWRAEDLAARRGVKGARRRLRGRLVTWTLYPICMALGTVVPEQNWQQVYDTDPRTAG